MNQAPLLTRTDPASPTAAARRIAPGPAPGSIGAKRSRAAIALAPALLVTFLAVSAAARADDASGVVPWRVDPRPIGFGLQLQLLGDLGYNQPPSSIARTDQRLDPRSLRAPAALFTAQPWLRCEPPETLAPAATAEATWQGAGLRLGPGRLQGELRFDDVLISQGISAANLRALSWLLGYGISL